ncbi:MAG: hypothetical protein NWF05_08230 [Candidatus Bathyarchaeota archaeon]|nr:hypothetical protein [Candidatus Bathyarchaeota archaeon]
MGLKKCRNEFDQILLASIDEALSSLGESAKTSIYFHIEHTFQLARIDIPRRVGVFSDALERIFGLGARHLETLMMKNLHTKLGSLYRLNGERFSNSDLTFERYVALMKQIYEKSESTDEPKFIFHSAGGKQYYPARRR